MTTNLKSTMFKPSHLLSKLWLGGVILSVGFSANLSLAQVASTPSTATSASNPGAVVPVISKARAVAALPSRPAASRVGEPSRFADLRQRIEKIKASTCQREYALEKAQAWLDMSRELYHEIAGSVSADAAYSEAEQLVKALESGEVLKLDTVLIQRADKLRPDLWAIADAKKLTFSQACCAAKEVAYCEFQLVRAGHAQANLGGSALTQPLIQIAEDICSEAKTKQCVVLPAKK